MVMGLVWCGCYWFIVVLLENGFFVDVLCDVGVEVYIVEIVKVKCVVFMFCGIFNLVG